MLKTNSIKTSTTWLLLQITLSLKTPLKPAQYGFKLQSYETTPCVSSAHCSVCPAYTLTVTDIGCGYTLPNLSPLELEFQVEYQT